MTARVELLIYQRVIWIHGNNLGSDADELGYVIIVLPKGKSGISLV